ncbi:MAG TPA: helix-turn-helix domain-containing protein [Sphingomicrobium sp.]|nr:helix-turn-helix domain-containing protein [Sphingomicrobium sp.]
MTKAPSAIERTTAAKLASLGSPIRLRLIRLLVRAGDNGLTVGDLQRRLELPPSTHAHHLSALVKSGLVNQVRRSREIVCTADFRALRGLGEYLLDQCCADAKPIETDLAA